MHTAVIARASIVSLCSALLAAGGPAIAQVSDDDRATIEEITVIGRYPGPPLWKVTSGARTLWIFGELSPVPKGLEWDPINAERVLDRAGGVIQGRRGHAGQCGERWRAPSMRALAARGRSSPSAIAPWSWRRPGSSRFAAPERRGAAPTGEIACASATSCGCATAAR